MLNKNIFLPWSKIFSYCGNSFRCSIKKTGILFIFGFLLLIPVSAKISYFGLSGLNFIPNGRTDKAGEDTIAFSSYPSSYQTLNIFPYAFRGVFTIANGFEIGFSNVWRYYIANEDKLFGIIAYPGSGFVAGASNVLLPIIPSVKFSFLDKSVPNGSLAVGIEYPFGIFLTFDYLLKIQEHFNFYFVFGLSTTISSLYGLGGIKAELPWLPMQLIIEAAYGGMTLNLTAAREVFLSGGITYRISSNVDLDFIYRIDLDGVSRLVFGTSIKF